MKKYLILILIAFSISSFAQVTMPEEKPYIEITGEAEKESTPDEIYIAITLLENQDGKDNRSIETQEKELKKGLAQIGIDLKNLTLSDASSNYIKVKWLKKDAVGRTEYQLKVTDATMVGKVFEKLDELKIQNAYIAKVDHSKMEEFEKEIRIAAIKDAKEKADYLLTAIGESTGKPLIVRENSNNFYPQVYRAQESMMYMKTSMNMDAAADTSLDFKKIKINASVYVKFAIK